VDSIHVATERLMGSMGDTPEMVRQARILALVGFISFLYVELTTVQTFSVLFMLLRKNLK